ncbi:cytochrome b [Paraferrimonas sp. SM1919]|uniref:cytochrome b n=1 Tax=Paraferrimonas sp. SM1919 TaxID=2662263 RepID=UPI0013D26D96|nr:cytochrome b [Paraferrimonas sp. SM1919]
MEKDTKTHLSVTTRTLHWTVGLLLLSLLAVGIYMTETKAYGLYGLHKSVGLIALILVIARSIWRVSNGFPRAISSQGKWLDGLAKTVHWLLLITALVMPLSGALMSWLGGHGLALFSVELVPANLDANSGKSTPINGQLAGVFASIHSLVGYLLTLGVVLHIVGAFKHHFINKDRTLIRMVFGK